MVGLAGPSLAKAELLPDVIRSRHELIATGTDKLAMTTQTELNDSLSVDASDQWMTQRDVARTCHVTVITVRTWIADGRLPAYRLGPKMIRIKRSDVNALLSPLPTKP